MQDLLTPLILIALASGVGLLAERAARNQRLAIQEQEQLLSEAVGCIALALGGGNLVPWISWAPVGDRIAYFVRTEKQKSLIIQNVLTGEIVRRIELRTVDEPESPHFSPDGTLVQDFCLVARRHALHVLNAPSPAATASLAIGEEVARQIVEG